jgi:hypothetical protein
MPRFSCGKRPDEGRAAPGTWVNMYNPFRNTCFSCEKNFWLRFCWQHLRFSFELCRRCEKFTMMHPVHPRPWGRLVD